MKKIFEKPVIEIELFEIEDIITESILSNGGDGIEDELGWGSIY